MTTPSLTSAPAKTGRPLRIGLPILILVLAVLPLIPAIPVFWITLANYIGLSAIVAIGLVVLTGVAGMTSFAQAAFMGFGAYTTALVTTQLGWSPWLGLPAALIVTVFAAWIVGLVTLRLQGHYLALGTLAWGIALYYLFGNLDFLGRHDGIAAIPPLSFGTFQLVTPERYYYVVWAFVALAGFGSTHLLRSRTGRAIRTLEHASMAGNAFGVDTTRARMIAFLHAALLAGLAGWLYAHMQRAVNPTPFGLSASIEYLFMIFIGGASHVGGAILGAAVVVIAKSELQTLLPDLLGTEGNLEAIVFGIVIILILQLARGGLWPLAGRLFPRGRIVPAAAATAPPPERRTLPARGTPLLEIEKIRKEFGGLVAVNDVSFSLKSGEIVGLIGPNGAGKSTTFNLVTSVLPPTSGSVRFLGETITGKPPRDIARLGIARTFQHVKLVPQLSAIENVAIGAHLRGHAGPIAGLTGLDRAEEARLFAEAERQIARVGLADLAEKPAGSLALGQQRVLEIARALCLDPVLLMLDEPAAGLRHKEKQDLAALLNRLSDEGIAILLVEHDMDFVMTLTHRIVVMDFGTKLTEGEPDIVRTDPRVIEAYLGGPA